MSRRLAGATLSATMMLLSSPLLAADIKCYVELEGEQRVILEGPVAQTGTRRIHEHFMQKGYHTPKGIRKVSKILECSPLDHPFKLREARVQEQLQPR